jgi:hypothetical protein
MPNATIFSDTHPTNHTYRWLILMHEIFTEHPSQLLLLHQDVALPDRIMPPGCMPGSHLVFLADLPLNKQHITELQTWLYNLPKLFQRLYDQPHPQRPVIINSSNYIPFAGKYLSYNDATYHSQGMSLFER